MMNQTVKAMHLFSMLLLVVFSCACNSQTRTLLTTGGSGDIVVMTISPSKTDIKIENANEPHFIKYKPSNTENKLLLFLGDTEEIPEKGPMGFFDVAIEEGYKVINLSYKTMESVTRVCRSMKLSDDSHCTDKLRTKRIYGTPTTNLIEDEPQDAIVNRLVKLLSYLSKNDGAGNWGMYLNRDQPNWELVTLAGQSQGGGMAEFIAKTKKVNRIISFSGGTDYSKTGKIAQWYYSSSKTPSNRWFGVYHTEEHKADMLASSFNVMEIPADHTFVLDLEVPKKKEPKYQGVRNTAYKETWRTLLRG